MRFVVSLLLVLATLELSADVQETDARANQEAGRKAYEARCASCHGSDGAGGGHGPSIVDISRPRAGSPQALRDLIRKGIPEAGMPATPLPTTQIDAIIAHLALLRASAADHPAPGNVAAGEEFFNGKGNCSGCHMVRGRGGVLGPDLSNLARERKLGQIETALKDLAHHGYGLPRIRHRPRSVSVRMRNGQHVRGLVKYEDSVRSRVAGLEGKFHSISKSEVAEITREQSLMPKLEGSPEELRNLLAYLTRLTIDRSPAATFTGSAPIGAGHKVRGHRSTRRPASGLLITAI